MKGIPVILLASITVTPHFNAHAGYFDECPILYQRVDDPAFIRDVASSNGLSSVRFSSIETPTQAQMILAYGKAKGLCGADTKAAAESAAQNIKRIGGRHKPAIAAGPGNETSGEKPRID
jgi:hypothetical protein